MRYTFHDFRRLFITDAIMHGMPPHIAQLVAGHRDINTTMGYKAVYPEEVINGHRAFIARRRALRPSEEYRTPTDDEWAEFTGLPIRTPQGLRRRLRPLLRHPLHPRARPVDHPPCRFSRPVVSPRLPERRLSPGAQRSSLCWGFAEMIRLCGFHPGVDSADCSPWFPAYVLNAAGSRPHGGSAYTHVIRARCRHIGVPACPRAAGMMNYGHRPVSEKPSACPARRGVLPAPGRPRAPTV